MVIKISPKYQVVIPKNVRDLLGIKSGTQIRFITKGNTAYLVPVRSLSEIQKKIAPYLKRSDIKTVREKGDRA